MVTYTITSSIYICVCVRVRILKKQSLQQLTLLWTYYVLSVILNSLFLILLTFMRGGCYYYLHFYCEEAEIQGG